MRTVTAEMEGVILALMGVLERPDAERPYLGLAEAYRNVGMTEEAESVIFLVDKRFGKDANRPDDNKKQPEDPSQGP